MDKIAKSNPGIDSILNMDAIRISKFLEQIQYAIIAFVIAFFVGSFTDKLFPLQKNINDISNLELWRDTLLQMSVIIISAYYISKVARSVPFYFALTKDYIISGHGESAAGAGLAMALIFVNVQRNFQKRLSLLRDRYYS